MTAVGIFLGLFSIFIYVALRAAVEEGRRRSLFCLGCRRSMLLHYMRDGSCGQINSDCSHPCTCPGGFQYVTRKQLP